MECPSGTLRQVNKAADVLVLVIFYKHKNRSADLFDDFRHKGDMGPIDGGVICALHKLWYRVICYVS